MSMKEEIIDLIAKTLDVGSDEIKEGVSLYDGVGVDSTEMVELSIAIGKHIGITLSPGEVTNKNTPNEIIEIVEKKKNG
ncbi:MAG: acyl carrier protein [Candidatus Omnitrophica bacterium]|nr:acyl carrier protein [Candidatus Omnitrophota bacterium]